MVITYTVNSNSAPVITSNGGGATASISVPENSTGVATVTATDADAGQTITYSKSGTDAGLFTLTAGGALTFTSAPNFEGVHGNTYNVTVTVTDNGAPNMFDTQDLTITVTNVNEAPVITSNGGGATASISIAENTTAVTIVTATDVDAGQTKTYSTSGTDAALFTLTTGGVLTFTAAPDFEGAHGSTYTLAVTVTDNGTPSTLSDSQDLTITVTNVNETPTITSNGGGASASINVAENTTAVTTIIAIDPDAATNFTFSKSGTDAGLFNLDSGTGALTFAFAPDFETTMGTYAVTVTATDNGTPSTLSDSQDLTITVTDVNEAPVITSNSGGATASINVAENTTAVTTVVATDTDLPAQMITYSKSGTNAGLFNIDSGTGALTFAFAPDFETVMGSYAVTVTATDEGTPNLSATQDLTINVTNVNEMPTITSNGGGSSATINNVAENSSGTLTTVTATDPDAGNVFTFSTSGPDAALFNIDSGGVLTFATAPDYESAHGPSYQVTVIANDNGVPNLSATQDLTINVTNVNEAPAITSNGGGSSATINNVAENSSGTLTTVTATDPDAATVFTFSVSGPDAALLNLDSGGVLTFISPPDYESAHGPSYQVTVIANDNGAPNLSATQDLTITVTDVNDAPVITSNGGGATAPINVAENTTTVTTVTETDADMPAQTLTYTKSGTNAALFNIDSGTGALTFIAAPDFETTMGTFAVTVTATDNGLPNLSDSQDLTITVTDVNEAPVITSNGGGATAPINVAENTTTVTTVTATDADLPAQTRTYSKSGTNAALFNIDSGTGALTFVTAPDFETTVGTFAVTVTATDDGTGALSDSQDLTITVTDVNEAPVITSNGGGATATINVAENTTAVTTVIATDADTPAQTLTYTKSGTNAALFSIDSGTGVLTFIAAPDFETVSGTYAVTVNATDDGSGTLSDSQDLTITVTNVNELPSFAKGANQRMPYLTTSAQSVSAWATSIDDGDSTVAQSLTFNITGNTTPGIFTTTPSIASDGTLTYTPNGTGGTSTISVTLTDDTSINSTAALTTAVQTFTITIDPAPNYTVVSSGSVLTVTDQSGNSDTLSLSEPVAANIQFAAVGRTFSVNGGLNISANSGGIPLTGITSIIVNAAAGVDIINVGAFSGTSFPSLTLNGGTGSDTVNMNGSITFAANTSLDVDLQNDDAAPGADSFNVNAGNKILTSGTGTITVKVSKGIAMDTGASLETVNGGITLEANQQAVATAGSFVGVSIYGINTIVRSTGTGIVSVKGQGGNSGASQNGIIVQAGGKISGGTTGTTVITGTGGPSTGNTNNGIALVNATTVITSLGSDVLLTGTGGGSGAATQSNYGVTVLTGAIVTAGGSGAVTVNGTGAAATTLRGFGVYVQGTGAAITSTNGNVSVTGNGRGATGSGNVFHIGIAIASNGIISAGGPGTVIVNGTAAAAVDNGNYGIDMEAGAKITSAGGNVNVIGTSQGTGTSAYPIGVVMFDNTEISSTGAGTVTLNATGSSACAATSEPDGLVLALSAGTVGPRIASAGGAILLNCTRGTPGTTAVGVYADAGSLITGGPVSIVSDQVFLDTSANPARINAGTGSVSFTTQTVGQAINLGADDSTTTLGLTDTELDAITASTLNIGSVTSGAVTISAAISPLVFKTLALGNNTSFGSAGGFVSDIGATASIFEKITVAGTLSLNATSTLSTAAFGGFIPVLGNSFKIIDNDGTSDAITGRFAGLAEGATLANYLGSGLSARITYLGGDGNDVVITVQNVEPIITSNLGGATASISLPENSTAVTTVTATDADVSQTLTFSKSGPDAALFNIGSSTGVLTFATAPDFEAPTDAGGDNFYDVTVTVTDSGSPNLIDAQALSVTVTNVNELPSFVKGTNQSIPYTLAAQSVSAWATYIDDGDSTVTQGLSFTVTEVGNSGIFTVAPGVSASGVLTYTPNGTAGTATFDISMTDDNSINGTAALTTATQQFTITVGPAPDYTVATVGNAIVVTDTSGNGDTLAITEPSIGNMQFAAAGRTFSVNGGFNITGDSGSIPLASVTSITVNAAVGADTLNVSAFTGTLPALTLNGGTGADAVNLNGTMTLAAAASLTVDLGTEAGDVITVNATPTLTGTATLNAKTIALNADVTGTVTGSVATAVTVASPAQIQDGINVTAATLATVQVGAGSYAEDIVIDRSLTLSGAGAAATSIVGPIGGPRAVTVLFSTNSSNSVLEGFTITRAGNNPTDWLNASLNTVGISIQFQTLSGITLRNNIVTGNRNGIDINDSNGHTIVNNVVSSNRTGLFFRNQTDNLVVEQNTITGNHTAGILFFPAVTNGTFQQTAANCRFTNNNISGNWYGQVQERQSGGVIPVPGTTNLKNLSGNWFGTATPTIVATNSTEPGYAALGVPVEFGGTAVPPVIAQPEIGGIASANLDITPMLAAGTDTDVETSPGRGTMGFQGNNNSLRVTSGLAQTGLVTRIQEGVNALAATGTLAVATGSYTENVDTSTKAVSLAAGASPGLITVNGNFTLDSNDTLPVEINGITAGTLFDQWVINGTVTLGAATLNLSGSHTPAANQIFTILDNDDTDAVSGTFNGLAEGAILTFNGAPLKLTYIGGTGNDVVLSTANTAPIITSNGGLATGTQSMAENTTAVTTVTATDADLPAQTLTFSMSGPDAALFNIGSSTGVLTFITAPDFEGPHGNTYLVTVTATDNGTPSFLDSQALTITVTDVADPITTPLGQQVITDAAAPDSTGADDGTSFGILTRGGYIAENGNFAFPGELTGTGVDSTNFKAYWKYDGSMVKRFVRTGDAAPDTGAATFSDLPLIPGINDDGQLTLFAQLAANPASTPPTNGDNDTGLWSELGGTGFKLLLRESDPMPGFPGVLIGRFEDGCFATAKIPDSPLGTGRGEAAFTATFKGSSTDAALLRASVSGSTIALGLIARENAAAPGTGETFGFLNSDYTDALRMDAQGNIVFPSYLKPSFKTSLWYQSAAGGAPVAAVIAGDAAPGTTATFAALDVPAMGSNGTFAFRGVLNLEGDNATNAKNDGIWRGSVADGFTNILRRGDSNTNRPGLFSATYTGTYPSIKAGNIYSGWLTNANKGAWLGWVDLGGDGINDFPIDTLGIYTDTSGTGMKLLIASGDPAPGIAGATLDIIDHPVVGGVEQVAFISTVTGGGTTANNKKGIWRTSANGGEPVLLLRTGDTMTTTPGGVKTIADLDIPGSSLIEHQWEQRVMDASGKLVIFIKFTDGTSSHILTP